MNRLLGTTAVVTGGGSGLGAAITERFVVEGGRVVVLDRSETKLRVLADRFGDSVRTVCGSVTDFADNAKACMIAEENFGGLDVLVGNAGLWDFSRSLLGSSVEHLDAGFDELFGVNVKGYLLGAKAAAPYLLARGGRMVFTLSNAALYPGGGGGVLYTASKHAGLGLVRQLAYELAPQIRVNAVAPGGMATDLRGPSAMQLAEQPIGDVLPIGQLQKDTLALGIEATPADYTEAYVLLAAEGEARTATGTVIDLTGVGVPRRPR
ncbi:MULTISPECIES: SDR family NAD(P)-dependent oxidoreductase [unclassified Mycobacterium]|uniref:SDR family NAD(P)-dependent oxidoreductase n=1 Tax=unclassified Mycobacterium TaxID=2642494 RepID=UPI0029C622A7|nr:MULTISPECIES: SDR family NAD(P)-dependent oxidoreductase [unclassified Mycobacterium]